MLFWTYVLYSTESYVNSTSTYMYIIIIVKATGFFLLQSVVIKLSFYFKFILFYYFKRKFSVEAFRITLKAPRAGGLNYITNPFFSDSSINSLHGQIFNFIPKHKDMINTNMINDKLSSFLLAVRK